MCTARHYQRVFFILFMRIYILKDTTSGSEAAHDKVTLQSHDLAQMTSNTGQGTYVHWCMWFLSGHNFYSQQEKIYFTDSSVNLIRENII